MIIDRIENYKRYRGLGERFALAFEYLVTTDFNNVKSGRYELDGDAVFAIISDYAVKKREACQLEAHRKYIDLQYMVKGMEWVGYAPLTGQKPATDYDEVKDIIMFNGPASFTKLDQGMFAIFFPHDLHMPGTGETSSDVRKVVVKIISTI